MAVGGWGRLGFGDGDGGVFGAEQSSGVSYGGNLWVVGGDDGEKLGDVWRSANGASWASVTLRAPAFAGRRGHQVVVHRAPFRYEAADISVRIPVVRVSSHWTPPVRVATLTATGGVGAPWFEWVKGAEGLLSVTRDGVVVATAFVNRLVTMSIRVGDESPLNRTTVAMTVNFVFPLTLSVYSAEYVVSPGYVGAVHSLAAGGGERVYVYSRVAGTGPLTVGADGNISLTTTMTVGSTVSAVFAAADAAGMEARFTLSVRVAAAGDYPQPLYLFGGRFESDPSGRSGYLNGVWRSFDGERWERMPVVGDGAPGVSRHQMVSFRGSLWVFGGRGHHGLLGGVWRSADGIGWVSMTIAENLRRYSHQMVSYGGSLWLVGGDGWEKNMA